MSGYGNGIQAESTSCSLRVGNAAVIYATQPLP